MILAIDCDDTIFENEYPKVGKPLPNAIPVLKKLQQLGHQLILWTCRDGNELKSVVDICKEKGLEFDAVNENIDNLNFKTSNKIHANKTSIIELIIEEDTKRIRCKKIT